MDLKELLGEELYGQLKEKLGDKEIGIVNDGSWLPKAKFDEVNNEKNQYKAQVDGLNRELGSLKDKAKDNEGVQTKIQELQDEITKKDQAMAQERKLNVIKFEALKKAPKDINDILPHIKQDIVLIDESGEVKGLKEQLETLRESKPYLFNETDPVGTGGAKGAGSKGGTEPKVENLRDAFIAHYKK